MIGLSPLPPGHPSTFQRKPVRPSSASHGAFSLPGGRSQSFASAAGDSNALFGLALAPGTRLKALTLAADARLVGSLCKRHAVTPKNGAPTARRRTVSGSLSLRSQRCFSPFPHGTRPLSVSRECLALADGAAGFGQGSSDPALLRVLPGPANVPRTGPSPSAARLSRRLPLRSLRPYQAALQPRRRLDADGLGWPPFARRYSGGHSCFPLLRLLGCFGSPGSPPPNGGRRAHARRVAPFGNPRIKGSSRLPAACRSLPRPSSPPGATGIHRAPSLACRRGHGRATDGDPAGNRPFAPFRMT